jgi:hypothetical protein
LRFFLSHAPLTSIKELPGGDKAKRRNRQWLWHAEIPGISYRFMVLLDVLAGGPPCLAVSGSAIPLSGLFLFLETGHVHALAARQETLPGITLNTTWTPRPGRLGHKSVQF